MGLGLGKLDLLETEGIELYEHTNDMCWQNLAKIDCVITAITFIVQRPHVSNYVALSVHHQHRRFCPFSDSCTYNDCLTNDFSDLRDESRQQYLYIKVIFTFKTALYFSY